VDKSLLVTDAENDRVAVRAVHQIGPVKRDGKGLSMTLNWKGLVVVEKPVAGRISDKAE
jgi:hypothetical protein